MGTQGRSRGESSLPVSPSPRPCSAQDPGVPAVVSFLQEADLSPGRQPGLSLLHRHQEPGTERTVSRRRQWATGRAVSIHLYNDRRETK